MQSTRTQTVGHDSAHTQTSKILFHSVISIKDENTSFTLSFFFYLSITNPVCFTHAAHLSLD